MSLSDKEGLMLSNKVVEKYLPAVLLTIIALIRFVGFDDWSLSNDELSTLTRSKLESLSIVIEEGVKPDVHPALVESFMHFWLKVFGDSVFAFRLPFLILSILGCYYFYLFSKSWLNKKAAILALSVLGFSHLFVLYSQIGRAYAVGFFLIMAFSLHWQKILSDNFKISTQLLYVLTGVLTLMTHYIAGLSLLLIVLIGFLLCKRKVLIRYLILSTSIGILFLPHLVYITIDHLRKGGVGWLPTPDSSFIIDFLNFASNDSSIWQALLILAPFFAAAVGSFHFKLKRSLPLLLIFLLSFLITYYYSIYRSSIIQFSGLIFSTPFLILFLFSFVNKTIKNRWFYSYLSLIILIGFGSLVYGKNFYSKKRFANFESIIKDGLEIKDKYGESNILSFANANSPEYFNYYFDLFEDTIRYDIPQFLDEFDVAKARNLIEKSKTDFAMISFANLSIPKEVYEFTKQTFPKTVVRNKYFNSETVLFSRSDVQREYSFKSNALNGGDGWGIDASKIQDSSFFSSPHGFYLGSDQLYAMTFRSKLNKIVNEENKWVTISAQIKSIDTSNVTFVVDVSRNGKSIHWRGFDSKFYYRKNQWYQFLAVWEKPDIVKGDDQVSIYIWNPDKSTLTIDDFEITNYNDSNYNFYEE